MVFLLHGEDPFRTRLRVGELVESLLAGGAGEPGDLSARPSPRLGGALGLTRIDARSDPIDAITMAGQSQGLFAAVDERQVVLVEHAEALPSAEFLASFPAETALVLVLADESRFAAPRARLRYDCDRGWFNRCRYRFDGVCRTRSRLWHRRGARLLLFHARQ